MLTKLKNKWHQLNGGTPGRRFVEHHLRRQGETRHRHHVWLLMALGAASICAGVVMLATPGPGIIFIAVGAALIAEESMFAAKLMDRCDVRVRAAMSWSHGVWSRASGILKLLLLLLVLVPAIGGAFLAYRFIF